MLSNAVDIPKVHSVSEFTIQTCTHSPKPRVTVINVPSGGGGGGGREEEKVRRKERKRRRKKKKEEKKEKKKKTDLSNCSYFPSSIKARPASAVEVPIRFRSGLRKSPNHVPTIAVPPSSGSSGSDRQFTYRSRKGDSARESEKKITKAGSVANKSEWSALTGERERRVL